MEPADPCNLPWRHAEIEPRERGMVRGNAWWRGRRPARLARAGLDASLAHGTTPSDTTRAVTGIPTQDVRSSTSISTVYGLARPAKALQHCTPACASPYRDPADES